MNFCSLLFIIIYIIFNFVVLSCDSYSLLQIKPNHKQNLSFFLKKAWITAGVGISISLGYPNLSLSIESQSKPFDTFLQELEDGKIKKVIFVGINPSYLQAYDSSGNTYEVKQGFPSYNDPKSPSGPAQVIAKVQHTPGIYLYIHLYLYKQIHVNQSQ